MCLGVQREELDRDIYTIIDNAELNFAYAIRILFQTIR